jgi:hypothetical protein
MYHGKMDSPPMPFSIARSAIFRHGRATCMYYTEMEDDHMCCIRKIDEANLKMSRVADFFFDENDQREKHDVCRCVSTFTPVKDDVDRRNAGPHKGPISAQTLDESVSIAYFSNSEDLCQYIKTSSFSGVVQHVSADCGPDLCETRYRMLKTTWCRQTISTEMKINIHRASSEIPVHEKFCTFDGPMHVVDSYSACNKKLNSKISAFIKTIKDAVNAYIPLSSEIWNGEFYLNHSRSGILRFEFATFVQIVAKQHFLSLETVDQLIPKPHPSALKYTSVESQFRLKTAASPTVIKRSSLDVTKVDLTRPQTANSISTLRVVHGIPAEESRSKNVTETLPQASFSHNFTSLQSFSPLARTRAAMEPATLNHESEAKSDTLKLDVFTKLRAGKILRMI